MVRYSWWRGSLGVTFMAPNFTHSIFDPESQKPLQRGGIAARNILHFGWFCGNVDKNLRCTVAKFPLSFMQFCGGNFHKTYAFWLQKFHKNWCYLIEIFPQKYSFWKVSPKICFLRKFPQKPTFLKNFHKDLLCWKASKTKLAFLENFHNHFALLGEFSETFFCCWKIPKKKLVLLKKFLP